MEEPRIRRGQASIEFIVTLGVVLIILILTGYIIFQKYVRTTDLKVYIAGKRIVDSLADNINTVNSIGDGYSIRVSLPYRMFSTRGYDIIFHKNEPTVFVHGEAFTISRILYFSSPISTDLVSCFMTECNNVCNESDTVVCLRVNRTTDVRIVNSMNGIFFVPEYNIVQDSVKASINPISGSNISVDMKPIADNVTGFRSLMYLYRDTTDESLYLVMNHNSTGLLEVYLNDTVGDLIAVESYEPAEMDLTDSPQGRWLTSGADYKWGVIKLKSNGVHVCITAMIPSGDLVWLNRDFERIILQPNKRVCIAYP